MTLQPLRVAVIGTGYGAAIHVPAVAARDDLVLACIADNGSGRAAGLAREGAVAFSDWTAALDHLATGAVIVAVPPAAQKDVAISAAERGLSILCEKPVGRSFSECHAVRATVQRSGVVAAAGFQFRFEPGILRLRDVIRADRLGMLREINVQWHTAGHADPARPMSWNYRRDEGGGILLSHMTHVLDLLAWLGAGQVKTSEGRLATRIRNRPGASGMPERADAEDFVATCIGTDRGVSAHVSIGNSQPGGRGLRITVLGDSGIAVFAHTPPFGASDQKLDIRTRTEVEAWRGAGAGDDTRLAAGASLLDHFVAAVRGGPSGDLPSLDDACYVHAALEQLRCHASA